MTIKPSAGFHAMRGVVPSPPAVFSAGTSPTRAASYVNAYAEPSRMGNSPLPSTLMHRLTFVHFKSQRERFEWEWERVEGSFGECLGGVRGYWGASRAYFV